MLVVSAPENPPPPSAIKRPAAEKPYSLPNESPINVPFKVYEYAPLSVCAEQVLSALSGLTVPNAISNGNTIIILYFQATRMVNTPFNWARDRVYSACLPVAKYARPNALLAQMHSSRREDAHLWMPETIRLCGIGTGPWQAALARIYFTF